MSQENQMFTIPQIAKTFDVDTETVRRAAAAAGCLTHRIGKTWVLTEQDVPLIKAKMTGTGNGRRKGAYNG